MDHTNFSVRAGQQPQPRRKKIKGQIEITTLPGGVGDTRSRRRDHLTQSNNIQWMDDHLREAGRPEAEDEVVFYVIVGL